jgi:hypothetical protein
MNELNNGTLGLIADHVSERSMEGDRLRYTKNRASKALALPSAQRSRSRTIEREIGGRDVHCPGIVHSWTRSLLARKALSHGNTAFRF